MTGYEATWEGQTPAGDPAAAAVVAPWAEAGATWWLEADWSVEGDPAAVTPALRTRIQAGPPTVSAGPGLLRPGPDSDSD